MSYQNPKIAEVASVLKNRLNDTPHKADILQANELQALYAEIRTLPVADRAAFGKEINALKAELEQAIQTTDNGEHITSEAIDVTAPFDTNLFPEQRPKLLSTQSGTMHPLMKELNVVLDIFARMGFSAVESRQIDDDYHMFETLNFPADHPARDDYDTFMTSEGLVVPAHASTMQNRLLLEGKDKLEQGGTLSWVYTGRVFRNEDIDARHEHTFYQVEFMHVGKNINVGNLMATLKSFLESYYGQELEIKTQPFYFPFTEPSFEFAISCPFCQKKGCTVCAEGWIELLGCGMIHPNVLRMGGVDPEKYTGFAAGMGLDRLVMIKNSIEDVRHFHSGKLEFLRQFI